MAAIDKLYITNFLEFETFRVWCLIHNPRLLWKLDNPYMTVYEWLKYSQFASEMPIACFSRKEDRYLLWNCNIRFVNTYLQDQCGFKIRWYHKLWRKIINRNTPTLTNLV